MIDVGVIDYGVGNLGSMLRALEELGSSPMLVTSPDGLSQGRRLILPGVGNFTDCMAKLWDGGWIPALHGAVTGQGVPLLGVCVGMQLLADHGDEGSEDSQGTPGLGFVPGRVRHLRTLGSTERMPHVGWNAIRRTGSPTPLLAGIPDGTDFYFVHSYAFTPQDKADEIASATCGIPFAAALQRGNVWGTQFHPEKSSRAGFRLLKNFLTAPRC